VSQVKNPDSLKWLLAAIVLIFGDIGTSPIYLFDVMFFETSHTANSENVLGTIGLVFYTLIFVSTKYMITTLDADFEGEGGIFALLNLLKAGKKEGRISTKTLKWATPIAVLGAAILGAGDGTLTPAISVSSAIEGLSVITDTFQPFILPICVLILFVLFYSQRWGTEAITKIFAPAMVAWFPVIGCIGAYWIFQSPEILWAIVDPRHAMNFLFSQGIKGALVIGGVVILAETGGEGAYADLSHTTKEGVRKAWFFLVLPSILLCYLGEGAMLLSGKEIEHEKIFFSLVSGNQFLLVSLVILATIATSVASLTLITGVQVLAQQAWSLGYLPRLKVVHTSAEHQGQIYVPAACWLLFLACLGVLFGFGSSSRMAAAYGWGVASLSLLTTTGLFLVSSFKLGWSRKRTILQLGAFFLIDLFFFLSTSQKFHEGAWFPIASGLVVYFVCDSWAWGRTKIKKKLSGELSAFNLEWLRGVSVNTFGLKLIVFTASPLDNECGSLVPYSVMEKFLDNGSLPPVSFCIVVKTQAPKVNEDVRYQLSQVCGFNVHTITIGFLDDPSCVAQILAKNVLLNDKKVVFGDEEISRGQLNWLDNFRFNVFRFLKVNSRSAPTFFGFNNMPEKVRNVGKVVTIGSKND
jgi:KUP system potassium uptake protein